MLNSGSQPKAHLTEPKDGGFDYISVQLIVRKALFYGTTGSKNT
jgi:hypothetical protein